jgi:uncharacterized protein
VRYANVLFYVDDPHAVAATRTVHRAYMADLLVQGKLAAGGPFADLAGALFIYEAASAAEAERLAAQDPYTLAGLIREHTIRPWQLVYSDPSLLARPPG